MLCSPYTWNQSRCSHDSVVPFPKYAAFYNSFVVLDEMEWRKKTQKVSVRLFIVILWWYCTLLCRSFYIQGIKLMQQKLHMVSCFKWKWHYSLYDKHTHVHNHALIYVLRHILFDQDQHNQRRSRAHVCAYNAQTCARMHNPGRKWERERDGEKATSHLSITPRHSCTLPHHSIADYSSACAGWLKWSEGYFVPNRQTMRHSPAWLSLWGKG